MENSQLSKKLKELRVAHGYKQEDVASMLGIVHQTYSHYETGKRTPDSTTLYKLSGFYNISVSDLMHLTIDIDRNIYYDAPTPTASAARLEQYIAFFNLPENKKRFQHFTNHEKEMLYYFQKLSESDKREMIEIAKIKLYKKDNV